MGKPVGGWERYCILWIRGLICGDFSYSDLSLPERRSRNNNRVLTNQTLTNGASRDIRIHESGRVRHRNMTFQWPKGHRLRLSYGGNRFVFPKTPRWESRSARRWRIMLNLLINRNVAFTMLVPRCIRYLWIWLCLQPNLLPDNSCSSLFLFCYP